jgi:hypothetical protein
MVSSTVAVDWAETPTAAATAKRAVKSMLFWFGGFGLVLGLEYYK